jgi:hypothetical protein
VSPVVLNHPRKIGKTGGAAERSVMVDEIRNPNNRVDRSANGGFTAFWHGQMVYENGRVKKFETEQIAWDFLARCDKAGKIIH